MAHVVDLIARLRQRAYQAINAERVELSGQIGEYISGKIAAAEWREGVVTRLADHLARTVAGLRGFSPENFWRTRQPDETYHDDPNSHRWCD